MRTAVFASALAAAIALTPAASAAAAKDPFPVDPNGLGGLSAESVNYGQQRNQDMDVWWAADGNKRPGVFLIHGGWWSGGDKKYMTEIARSYADQGYVVFNLNYRLSTQESWPAQRSDAFSAIAVARKHADRWAFDASNFVVVGFSAGGHIAAAVGTYGNGVAGLKGVVGLSPVISPLRAYADGHKSPDVNKRRLRLAAIRLAGGCEPKGKCSRVWASMEVPWHASAKDAPMLMLHAEKEFVPPVQSQLLKDMLGQVGVDVTVVTQPGDQHSAPLYREPGVAERVQQWISERIG
ncbi:alpha/beta hydrolase [Nonomuraea typhae]|uniref:alpha/beta hydrolase n=1 Tax=Nonomuraea typhae TaxID=2603600 RepID=UPI001FE7ED8B|nr:alpha/beta hydrolase [Nonomuraea typhae]